MRIGDNQLRVLVMLGSPTMSLVVPGKECASLIKNGLLQVSPTGGFACITAPGLRAGAIAETMPDGTIRITPLPAPSIPPPKDETYVYFVQAKESKRIKIGFSARLGARMLAVSTYCPEPIEVLGWIVGTIQDELALHARFAEHRYCGEWFTAAPELVAYIQSVASRHT